VPEIARPDRERFRTHQILFVTKATILNRHQAVGRLTGTDGQSLSRVVVRFSKKMGGEIQDPMWAWPILNDTAPAHRGPAGGDEKATSSASWLMWGSDQDDRSFFC
jgi:hypothetical protein